MKKVFLLVSLALVLGLVMGCPQPTDGSEARVPLTNEQGQTLMKAVLEETVITLTPVYDGETGGLTLKAALHGLVPFADRREITEIHITTIGSTKIIPEEDLAYLFSRFYKLTKVIGFEHLNTSRVTDMAGMFSYTNFISLNLSSFNTVNVVNMSSMFDNTNYLFNLDLSSFNTEKVIDSETMFSAFGHGEVTVGSNLTQNISEQIKPSEGPHNGVQYANPGKWVKDGVEYDTIPVVDGKAVAGTYTAKLAE